MTFTDLLHDEHGMLVEAIPEDVHLSFCIVVPVDLKRSLGIQSEDDEILVRHYGGSLYVFAECEDRDPTTGNRTYWFKKVASEQDHFHLLMIIANDCVEI